MNAVSLGCSLRRENILPTVCPSHSFQIAVPMLYVHRLFALPSLQKQSQCLWALPKASPLTLKLQA